MLLLIGSTVVWANYITMSVLSYAYKGTFEYDSESKFIVNLVDQDSVNYVEFSSADGGALRVASFSPSFSIRVSSGIRNVKQASAKNNAGTHLYSIFSQNDAVPSYGIMVCKIELASLNTLECGLLSFVSGYLDLNPQKSVVDTNNVMYGTGNVKKSSGYFSPFHFKVDFSSLTLDYMKYIDGSGSISTMTDDYSTYMDSAKNSDNSKFYWFVYDDGKLKMFELISSTGDIAKYFEITASPLMNVVDISLIPGTNKVVVKASWSACTGIIDMDTYTFPSSFTCIQESFWDAKILHIPHLSDVFYTYRINPDSSNASLVNPMALFKSPLGAHGIFYRTTQISLTAVELPTTDYYTTSADLNSSSFSFDLSLSNSSTPTFTFADKVSDYLSDYDYDSDTAVASSEITLNIIVGTTFSEPIEIPCSRTGSETLTYTAKPYLSYSVPSWIIGDYDNFLLNGTAPSVSSNETHYFMIRTTSTDWIVPSSNMDTIVTLNLICETTCSVDNCDTCMTCNSNACNVCSGGYTLNSTDSSICFIDNCGDGIVGTPSAGQCDDGNTDNGDGCGSLCTVETGWTCTLGDISTASVCTEDCGDGKVYVPTSGYCDDGGSVNNDGCDSSCAVETGWTCTLGDSTTASVCSETCGDGKVINPAAGYCDDGDTDDNDGCSSTCAVETGWTCTAGDSSTASVCTEICGDGKVLVPTAGYCDDGDTTDGDGCSSTCAVEADWACTPGDSSTASVCSDLCGDGKVIVPAAGYCDDGGTEDGDGCSSTCTVEVDWSCTLGDATTASSCTNICGNGIVGSSLEGYCDDGNSDNGDGCDDQCQTESNWLCQGGSATSADVCVECNIEFCLTCTSTDYTKCELCEEGFKVNDEFICVRDGLGGDWRIQADVEATAPMITTAIVTGSVVSIAMSSLKISGGNSAWSLFHQLQLLILFLIIPTYIAKDVREFIEAQDFVLFTFNFIPLIEIPYLNALCEWMDSEQTVEELKNLGLESHRTFNNLFSLILILSCMWFIHMGMKLSPKAAVRNENDSWLRRNWSSIRVKVLNFFFYIFYVRMLLESNETMVLSTVSEIHTFDTSTAPAIISLVLAFIVMVVLTMFLIFSWHLAYKFMKDYDPQRKFFFMEFFADVKQHKYARFYTPLLLFRRYIFVLIIIPLAPAGRHFIFSCLLVFNIPYAIFIGKVRPFEDGKDNLIEFINECFYIVFIAIFWGFDSEKKWTEAATRFCLYLITLNSFLTMFIILAVAAAAFTKFLKKKCARRAEVEPINNETVRNLNEPPRESRFIQQEGNSDYERNPGSNPQETGQNFNLRSERRKEEPPRNDTPKMEISITHQKEHKMSSGDSDPPESSRHLASVNLDREEYKQEEIPDFSKPPTYKSEKQSKFSKIDEEEFKDEQLDFEDPFELEEKKEDKISGRQEEDLQSILLTDRSITMQKEDLKPASRQSIGKSLFTSRHDIEESKAQIEQNASQQEVEESKVESFDDHLEVPQHRPKVKLPESSIEVSEVHDWDVSKHDKSESAEWNVNPEPENPPENDTMVKKSTLEETKSKSEEVREEASQEEAKQEQPPAEVKPEKTPEELKKEKEEERKRKQREWRKDAQKASKNMRLNDKKSIVNMLNAFLGKK